MESLANRISEHQRNSYHLLKLPRDEWEIENEITGDGSVDFRGRPARKALTGGWKACGFLIWYEMIERLTYFGILSNLITYLTVELREGTVESANNVNIWSGFVAVIPIVGAFISDGYLGRYRAIGVMSAFYILGLICLSLSVTVEPFKPAKCHRGSSTCPEVTQFQIAFFFISLYLIAIGMGGVKPCLQAFGADQLDDTDPVEKEKKSSFFNWRSFGCSTGSLLAFTFVLYIQDNGGWGTSFGIITVSMVVSVVLFLAGSPFYRRNAPSKSSLNSIADVIIATASKWNVKVPDDSCLLYENHNKESLKGGIRKLLHTKDLSFLDKAATKASGRQSQLIMDEDINVFLMDDGEADRLHPSMLCTVTQVEEVKLFIRMIPIWMTSLMCGVVTTQVSTLFTKQGNTMERQISSNFTIPAASLRAFTTALILILLPVYDRILIPITRRLTGNERGITLLQRIGFGLYLSIIMMIIAAVTESKRLKTAGNYGLTDNPNVTIPMSIFWLLPQYLLYGVIEMTAIVGQQEFFYDQVPDGMRSIGMALYLTIYGVGSFISGSLITLVDSITSEYTKKSWFSDNLNQCRLDYFYLFLAFLSALNMCVYLLAARSYTYKKIG